jgi:rubrerythrin
MNLGEAIKTAIDYEGKVYATYVEAMDAATDDIGRRVFQTLRDEEKSHLDYLRERLDEWQSSGTITVETLDSAIPDPETIQEGIARLREKVGGEPSTKHQSDLEMLRRALVVETETSSFYRQMVSTLDSDGQRLFERFVEIEEGHRTIVQAEIDCLSGTGMWFDTKEFDLSGG